VINRLVVSQIVNIVLKKYDSGNKNNLILYKYTFIKIVAAKHQK